MTESAATTATPAASNSGTPAASNLSGMSAEQFGTPQNTAAKPMSAETYGSPPRPAAAPSADIAAKAEIAAPAKPAPKPALKRMAITNLQIANYVRHRGTADKGTEIEDTLDPAYWANVAKKMTIGDIIEVLAYDYAWFAELFVLASGGNFVKVALMRKVEFGANAASIAGMPADARNQYEISYHPARKFRVIRLTDNKVMREDLATREEAEGWLRDHLKALAA